MRAESQMSMREVLEMLGHTVSIGRDGAEGIAVAREFAPEIVFCDIGLPAMDGYEVARQLRILVPSAVLVAVTGYARPEDQRQAREAGFHGHLCKPTRLEDIEALLTRL